MIEKIWTIGYCSRSGDNYYASADDLYAEIDEEEGFFTSEAAARQRADELNKSAKERWEQENERARQQHAEKLAVWEEQQCQIKFLTANGFAPGRGAPKPLEPKAITYENWLWRDGGRSTHEVVELKLAEPKRF